MEKLCFKTVNKIMIQEKKIVINIVHFMYKIRSFTAHKNTIYHPRPLRLVSDVIGCFLLNLLQCLLVFITGAFPILAYCANKHKSQYFQDIIQELLGPGAYIVTQILVVLYMFGCTVAYMIVIGDQLEKGT